MTRNMPSIRNQIDIDQRSTPKTTKIQGQVGLGRTTFIDEIVRKSESQASIGPREVSGKGYTIVSSQVAGTYTTTNAEIHDKAVGFD